MKRYIGVFLALCMAWCVVPVPVTAVETEVSAVACVLMEAATGRVLYEKNAEEKLPMASTTKIMTTLLTLESGELDTEFTVDNAAIHVEGSSMGLQEDDIVTKRALCYGMLLPSGNDAANAAAVAVAGSIDAFVDQMNAYAKEIGMTRTCFVTPSGLDGTGHGSSAYDMALLTREALRNEAFREICSSAQATVCFGNPPYERTLYNSNKLLGMYEGVIGVKTGFTDEAGRCLVSACERDGVTLICVTLNDPDDWQDHISLYESAFAEIVPTTLAVPENLRMTVVGSAAENVTLKPAEELVIGVPEGETPDVSVRVLCAPFAYAPVQAGDVLGTLEYTYQGKKVADVPLLAAENAAFSEEKPVGNPWMRFWTWLSEILRI
jgi:D-alanyl-D-alanine carboxypeptidase/D-alanyl-D-alanine carboxypeptidase (penicillin-binding protein 5/6)